MEKKPSYLDVFVYKTRKSKVISVSLILASSLLFAGCTEQDKEDTPTESKLIAKDDQSSKSNSTVNLDSSIKSFLDKISKEEGIAVQTMITDNFNSVEGVYAYPVEITKLGSTVEMNIGLSNISVPKQKVLGYDGFMEKVKDLKEDSKGLALVKYESNNIVEVEVYQLDHTFENLQESIAKYEYVEDSSKDKVSKKETKGYKDLSREDWKGMALLAAREAISKDLAPIFIVPNTSLKVKTDLVDTYIYIIVGELKKVEDGKTTLKTYEEKTISLDFEVKAKETQLNTPSWIYVMTQDGKVKNIELQSFPEANMKTMAEGVMTYINVTAAENATSKK